MAMNFSNKKRQMGEEGFAAIVIAVTLILVLSLITIGFAELMRKEQRSALDKHLSRQAYYAAESGVNDAAKAIAAGYDLKKTSCGPTATGTETGVDTSRPGAQYLTNPKVGTDNSVSYTCLLIDPMPQTLEYAPEPGNTKVTEVSGVDVAGNPARITRLIVAWQQDGGSNDAFISSAATHTFPTQAAWSTSTGVVRVGLTPLTSDCLTRDCLLSRSYTSFLYPKAGGARTGLTAPSFAFPTNPSVPAAQAALDAVNGPIIDGSCNNSSSVQISSTSSKPMACIVQITGLVASDYLLTLKNMYRQNKITVIAYGSSGQMLYFKNAQTVVDSTGKAQDVLRRIQVRIPNRNSYDVPDSSLDVMGGLCKQLRLTPSSPPQSLTGC